MKKYKVPLLSILLAGQILLPTGTSANTTNDLTNQARKAVESKIVEEDSSTEVYFKSRWTYEQKVLKARTDGHVEYEMAFRHHPIDGQKPVDLEQATFYTELAEDVEFISATFGGVYDEENHRVIWENPGGILTTHANFNPETPRRVNLIVRYPHATQQATLTSYATYTAKEGEQQRTRRTTLSHSFEYPVEVVPKGIFFDGKRAGGGTDTIATGEKFTYDVHYSLNLPEAETDAQLMVTLPKNIQFDKHVQLTGDFRTYRYDEALHAFIFYFHKNANAVKGTLKINNLSFLPEVTESGEEATIQLFYESKERGKQLMSTSTLIAQAEANWEVNVIKLKPQATPQSQTKVIYRVQLTDQKREALGKLQTGDLGWSFTVPEEGRIVKVRDAHQSKWTNINLKDSQKLERSLSPERDYQFDVYVEYNANPSLQAEVETSLIYTPKGEKEVTKQSNITHSFTDEIVGLPENITFKKENAQRDQSRFKGQRVTMNSYWHNDSNKRLDQIEWVEEIPEAFQVESIQLPKIEGAIFEQLYVQLNNDEKWLPWTTQFEESSFGKQNKITKVKAVWKDVLPIFEIHEPLQMTYTIIGDQIEPIHNESSLFAYLNEDVWSYKASETVELVHPHPVIEMAVASSQPVVTTDGYYQYSIAVKNDQESGKTLKNPHLNVVLPAEVQPVEWSWRIDGKESIFQPHYDVQILEEQKTKRLSWYWDENLPFHLEVGESLILTFKVKTREYLLGGAAHMQVDLHSPHHSILQNKNTKELDGRVTSFHTMQYMADTSLKWEEKIRIVGEDEWKHLGEQTIFLPNQFVEYEVTLKNNGVIPIEELRWIDSFYQKSNPVILEALQVAGEKHVNSQFRRHPTYNFSNRNWRPYGAARGAAVRWEHDRDKQLLPGEEKTMIYHFQVPAYSGNVMRDRFVETSFEKITLFPNHHKKVMFQVVSINE